MRRETHARVHTIWHMGVGEGRRFHGVSGDVFSGARFHFWSSQMSRDLSVNVLQFLSDLNRDVAMAVRVMF